MAVPPTSAAFCLVALLAAAGCAGSPSLARVVEVEEGVDTTVQLVKFEATGRTRAFTLINLSSAATHEVYSGERQRDALTKVVSDEKLQLLLDIFAEKGLFAGAAGNVPADARATILVTKAGERFALHGAHFDLERKRAFSEAQAYFLAAYNSATAYHSADIDRGDLRAAEDRLRDVRADAIKKRGGDGGRDR